MADAHYKRRRSSKVWAEGPGGERTLGVARRNGADAEWSPARSVSAVDHPGALDWAEG
jgi:hypothetical protein